MARSAICDQVRLCDLQRLGNWLGGHSEKGKERLLTPGSLSAKQVINVWQLMHTTGNMLHEHSAPTHLQLLLSGRRTENTAALDPPSYCLKSLDTLGACKKNASQPHDSRHPCDVEICSWILMKMIWLDLSVGKKINEIIYFNFHRNVFAYSQMQGRSRSRFFLMSLPTWKETSALGHVVRLHHQSVMLFVFPYVWEGCCRSVGVPSKMKHKCSYRWL